MNSRELVSVIVLTKNSQRYIRRCLQSILAQTYQNFEVLIVDAGSSDQTREIVKSFDSRFQWHELVDSDMGAARNLGMNISRGQLITFLDSDDIYLPDNLCDQVNFMMSNLDISVCFSHAYHVRTHTPLKWGLKVDRFKPRSVEDYLFGINHNVSTMMIWRRVFLSGFIFGEGDRGRYAEEWRLQARMALAGVSMAGTNKVGVIVEMRPDSHTSWDIQVKMKREALAEIEELLDVYPNSLFPEIKREFLDLARLKLMFALLLNLRLREAWTLLPEFLGKAMRIKARVIFCTLYPFSILSAGKLIRYLWVIRQNRSFAWQDAPANLVNLIKLSGEVEGD